MNEWAVPTVAVLLLAYAAVSARLRPTVVTQAMVFVACGLLVGDRVLDLVDADVANPLQLPVTAVSVSGEGGVSSHG